jgi:hypothetical protein
MVAVGIYLVSEAPQSAYQSGSSLLDKALWFGSSIVDKGITL